MTEKQKDKIRRLLCPGCTCPVGSHDSAGTCNNHRSCGCYRNADVAAVLKGAWKAQRRRS